MKDKYIKRLNRLEKNQEEILKKLDQIISGQGNSIPNIPNIPWDNLKPKSSVCLTCGIDLEKNNMYYCPRNDCPSRIIVR